MNDADNAWQEWNLSNEGPTAIPRLAFMAGYRRALEDAAKALVSGGPKHPYNDDETTRINAWCGGLHYAAQELRDRASSVGTKDGASDHE